MSTNLCFDFQIVGCLKHHFAVVVCAVQWCSGGAVVVCVLPLVALLQMVRRWWCSGAVVAHHPPTLADMLYIRFPR